LQKWKNNDRISPRSESEKKLQCRTRENISGLKKAFIACQRLSYDAGLSLKLAAHKEPPDFSFITVITKVFRSLMYPPLPSRTFTSYIYRLNFTSHSHSRNRSKIQLASNYGWFYTYFSWKLWPVNVIAAVSDLQ